MSQAELFEPAINAPPINPAQVQLIEGDCLSIIPKLPQNSVALAMLDLPYTITACKWDVPIDIDALWGLLNKTLAANALVCATATMRFIPLLMTTNAWPLKYDLVWHKSRSTGFLNAKKAPLRAHEHILVFGKKDTTYNPQMLKTWRPRRGDSFKQGEHGECYGMMTKENTYTYGELRYPTSVIDPISPAKDRGAHPTQKPLELIEWLIKTYTKEGDTILDPTSGSGTTAVAALNVGGGRNVICIEKDPTYFEVMSKRVAEHKEKLGMK